MMSHLIKIYTVCPLVFESQYDISLDLIFSENLQTKFCRLLLVVEELKIVGESLTNLSL